MIWDAVSKYILGQLRRDKGVLVTGLGTFVVIQEQFTGQEKYVIRRPVFQLDVDELFVEDFVFPTVVIPGNAVIKPLNYSWLSRATFFPQHMVESCVQETILLYSFLLRNGHQLDFVFKDIGVLSSRDHVLCMKFYYGFVTELENKASWIALLRTRLWMPSVPTSGGANAAQGTQAPPAPAFPRFQFPVIPWVARAFSTWHKKATEKRKRRTGAERSPGKMQQSQVKFSLPLLPRQKPGTEQQETGKKLPAGVLPPRAGSSLRTKKAGGQQPAPPAQPTSALPSSRGCRKVLQEVHKLCAEWEQVKSQCQDTCRQTLADCAAWEAWFAGQDQQPPQALRIAGFLPPCSPAQPRTREVRQSWRKAANLPANETLQPKDHLSPRAVQVLRSLEQYQAQRYIFRNVVENNIRRQKQQHQASLPHHPIKQHQ